MTAALSYLGAHWTLFIIVVLAVIGLIAAAFMLHNLKYVFGAVVLVIAGLAYQSSNMDGYKRRVNEDAQAQVTILQSRLLALSMAAAEDNKQATANAFLITKLKALSSETPSNAGPCLDASAANRVRAIRGPIGIPLAAPVPAKRHTSVLPWRSGRP